MTGSQARRLYLDTNVLIYVVEGTEPFRTQLGQLMEALDDGLVLGVTSELTLAEAMVKPFASRNDAYIAAYSDLLSGRSALEVLPVDRAVLEHSARLRAEIGGKLADGIHVATAARAGCTHFISEDGGIKVPPDISLVKTGGIQALLASFQGSP